MAGDSVELPCRLCIRLRVLPTYRQTHRMPLANVTSDHPLVSNILPHLALQVRFYPQPAQRVRALGLGLRERRRRCVELCEVCTCAGQVLQEHGPRRGLEGGGRERCTRRGGRGGKRGEEGSNGCDLRWGELANAAGVADLEAGADATGGVVAYFVEKGQGMLRNR
jgi:hypothetical protein